MGIGIIKFSYKANILGITNDIEGHSEIKFNRERNGEYNNGNGFFIDKSSECKHMYFSIERISDVKKTKLGDAELVLLVKTYHQEFVERGELNVGQSI